MNHSKNMSLLVLLLSLSACGSQVVEFPLNTSTDANIDGAGGDVAAADIGADAAADAPVDAPVDAAVDASADGAVDAGVDAAADAAADTTADVTVDVLVDVMADVAADATADATPDAGADTNADTGADATPDAGADVVPPTAPTVIATVPVNGATGVAVTASVSATFSKAMAAATVSSLSFKVQQGSTPVLGTVTMNAAATTATFVPAAVLQNSLVYTCTVTTGAKSGEGVALASDYIWSFTTTAAPATPPTVESTIPLNNALSVPTATKVTTTFSKSMDPLTITVLTFLVAQGTTPVAGAVTFDAVTDTATFTPNNALAAGLIYTATVTTGVKDSAGLAMQANYTWIFTTNVVAPVPPTVQSTTPLSGALAVPTSVMPTATFSKAMDALSISDTTFLLALGAVPVSGTISLNAATNTATFEPDAELDSAKVYTATITTGAKDSAGNALVSNHTWSFTTAAPVLVAPQVQATSPLHLATNVSTGKKPTAVFSKAMDAQTLSNLTFTLSQGATPVPGAVTYDIPSKTATFWPTAALAAGLPYSATITTGATDTDGLTLLAAYTWQFTTAAVIGIAPTVDETTPLNAAIDVPIGSTLSATFSKAMDPLKITGLTFVVHQGLNAVAGAVTLDALTNTAIFTPTLPLGVGLPYSATITTGALDLGGLALAANYGWTFTTASPPQVTATTPLNNATKVSIGVQPTVTFNKSMDPLTLTALTFTVKQGLNPVTGVVTFNAATKTATFKPALALGKGLLYTCSITTGVKALGGLPLAVSYDWVFTTAEAAPTVIVTNPLNLATNVSINKRPTATFSKAMDPLTLTALTYTVANGLLPISGVVTFDGLTKTATFTPAAALVGGVTYTATITTGAKDTGGSALAADYVWTFTTSVCSQAPVVLGAASTFVVLGGSTVTSTGLSSVTGDLGVSPGTAVTGFPPGTVIGAIHAGDPTAALGIANLTTAYNDAAGRTLCPVTVAGNLGGTTLAPGLYKSTSSLAISSGDLTLDAQGDSDAVFIFQMASTLTTTSGRQVILAGGAKSKNIFWQVGTSATIGTTSAFVGTIMADQAITLMTGATLNGRALARIAAVTLDSNIIVKPAD